MLKTHFPLTLTLTLLFAPRPAQADPPEAPSAAPPAEVRRAVTKALDLIQRSTAVTREKRTCFTCHHQTLPTLALAEAKAHGLEVDANNFREQLEHTAAHIRRGMEGYRQGRGQGGGVDTAGFALWTLQAGDWQPDEATGAVAEYLLRTDPALDHWRGTGTRPPTQASDITRTAVILQGLDIFGTEAQRERIAARRQKAEKWLLAVKPRDTEDKVYKLQGLAYLGYGRETTDVLAADLILDQREDGGWAQKPGLESDAYATGTVLTALHQAAGMRAGDPVYRRGVRYLLDTQLEDGSWHVKSRSRPFQPYFESGFPHGDDQFISIGATSWAVTALVYALTEKAPAAETSTGSEFDTLTEADRRQFSARFEKELWPLFTRHGQDGCVGCHDPKHRSSLKFSGDADQDFRMLLHDGFLLPDDPGSVLHVVSTKDRGDRMPPDNRPGWTPAEVERFRDFVLDLDKCQRTN